jgi:NTE family protein
VNGAVSGRDKIDLVLAGGGARGIAHVGVIRALEALQVLVDGIAGTSMGALVGGLYATGMNAEVSQKMVAEREGMWI